MGTSISDRLFVALAKKVGFPEKQVLRQYRSMQMEMVEAGLPITLFSLARLKGVLDAGQVERFVGWAQQVVSTRPKYAGDLVADSGAPTAALESDSIFDSTLPDEVRVVEVQPEWLPAETRYQVSGDDDLFGLLEPEVVEVSAEWVPDHADHTEELLELLDEMSSEEELQSLRPSTQAIRSSRRNRRFTSDDMLPVIEADIDEIGAPDEPSTDDLISLLEGGSPQPAIAFEEDEEELFGLDDDLEILPDEEPVAAGVHLPNEDSALFEVASWDFADDPLADAFSQAPPPPPPPAPLAAAAPPPPPPLAPLPALGPQGATASAEFTGSWDEALDFDPMGSLGSTPKPNLDLYETLASGSGFHQGYQPEPLARRKTEKKGKLLKSSAFDLPHLVDPWAARAG